MQQSLPRSSRGGISRRLALWCATVVLLACSACTANGFRLNLAPLFDYELDRSTDSVSLSILGPILHYESQGERSLFALRPFFSIRSDPQKQTKNAHVLYPLVHYNKAGRDERFTVLMLYDGRTFYDTTGKRDSDYMLFPFIWYGSGDDPLDHYFAVFPFGGTINGKFGLDEFKFIVFPLYVKTRFRERERTHACWPFCTITEFPQDKSKRSVRYWPFYGKYEKIGKSVNSFYMWPFYTTEEIDLDTDHPTRSVSFFPFYAYSDTVGVDAWSRAYLFLFTFGHDERMNMNSVSFPWPLIVFESSDSHVAKSVWPFWGYFERGGVTTHALAFPFIWWQKQETQKWTKSSQWFVPLYWHHLKQFKDSEAYESQTKLWPLWGRWHNEDGSERTEAFSLLWFEDPDGFDRDWSPLWRVYESRRRANGDSRTDLLWGFFRHDRKGDKSYTDITPLFGYNSDAQGGGFSLLQGLLGVQKGADGLRVRLLWFFEI